MATQTANTEILGSMSLPAFVAEYGVKAFEPKVKFTKENNKPFITLLGDILEETGQAACWNIYFTEKAAESITKETAVDSEFKKNFKFLFLRSEEHGDYIKLGLTGNGKYRDISEIL